MGQATTKRVITPGKHVNFVSRNGWEYVERPKITGIVGIIAVTDDRKLVLIEQYRPPVDKRVIEIPAGLAGDVAGQETEELAAAAKRELLEETGYEATRMRQVGAGASSAGITDEIITLFLATGLKKTGDGKGDGSEDLTLHEVPLGQVKSWLDEQTNSGLLIDLKVYGGLYFAETVSRT